MTIQALSTKEISYRVLDELSVRLKVEENPYFLALDNVFSMAARNNPKRSYLFVSKLIGKHIPVRPAVPFVAGFLLASRLAEVLGLAVDQRKINEAVTILSDDFDHDFRSKPYFFPGRALFIGFAETATALGHAVFNCYAGAVQYLHTTRENLVGAHDTLFFTEDHCHAPDQRCLIPDSSLMQGHDLVVLIDDEITSGNTGLNIIKAIQQKYPQKKYVILTILDWRSAAAQAKYKSAAEELGVEIKVVSLLKGRFWAEGTAPVIKEPLISGASGGSVPRYLEEKMGLEIKAPLLDGPAANYLGYTGRFGLDARHNSRLLTEAREIGQRLASQRKGKRTLCLGTGEFMYIPFLIAKYMGEGIRVQSTTRSPVQPYLRDDYAVKHAIRFRDPFIAEVKNYVYNIPANRYDEVFVFWEKKVLAEQVAPFVRAMEQLAISNIVFVSFCH
jgi:hypothetical protein